MTGKQLRKWREGIGWTQTQAANALGISLRAYQNYEADTLVTRMVELATEGLIARFATK